MHISSLTLILPSFISASIASALWLKPALEEPELILSEHESAALVENQRNFSPLIPSSLGQNSPATITPQIVQTSTLETFRTLNEVELRYLSHDELLIYMLDFRRTFLTETDFMAKEYRLFQQVLDAEPFAALDYMVATGHDSSSEFFYHFLYTDFMVYDSKSSEVIDYINTFGPQASLLNLITFANLSDQISPLVKREIIAEYILGNVEYHSVLRATDWYSELSQEEKITSFINTVPEYVKDPYDLILDILEINSPSTQDKLAQYLEVHEDRYRLYNAIRLVPNIDLSFTIQKMMNDFSNYAFEDQVQIALIAIDYGHYEALHFLTNLPKQPVNLGVPLNIEYALLNVVSVPEYIEKNLAWVKDNEALLTFNPYSRKFEY